MLCASLLPGKAWQSVGLWHPEPYGSSRTDGQGCLRAPRTLPVWVWSRDGHPSSQPSGDTPGHCPHPARGWTQRPQLSPCIPQLHWLVRMQPWDTLRSGPASKRLPMPSSNGPAPSGNGPVPAARGGEAPHRLPSPCSFTFTCPCLLLPPPQSTCPHLTPKITPRKRTTIPERHCRTEALADAPRAWGRRCSQISWINQTDTTLSQRPQAIGTWLSTHSSVSLSCDAPAPLPKALALSPARDVPTGDPLP